MKYNLKTIGFELTPAIRQYLDSKIGTLYRFLPVDDQSLMLDIEIGRVSLHHRHGEVYKAELNLRLAHDGLLRVEVTDNNLYNAIHSAKADLVRQLKSKRTRHDTLMKRGGRKLKSLMRRNWSKN